MNSPRLVLASASPRRRELLGALGIVFDIHPVDTDESRRPGESPADLARRLARSKAVAAAGALGPGRTILAADTVVALGETVYGKPADAADAAAMLESLAGREHRVYTAVSLTGPQGDADALSQSLVRFARLSEQVIEAYVATGEPMDKAGAYAIQGLAGMFVEHLSGSYSGVMGLPVFETARLLEDAGLAILPSPEQQT